MNFPFYITKRYLITSSSNSAINIISKIASVGIVVSAMALFVVLSIFSGLKSFSLSFSNDFDPDLKILPKEGKSFVLLEREKQGILSLENVAFYSKVVEEKVLFVYNNKEQVAYIKGVDRLYNHVNNVSHALYSGQWLEQKTPEIVLGNGISQKLSLGLFDRNQALEIYVPKAGKGTISSPEAAFNKSVLLPVGIYAINEELDSKYVFADLKLTQQLLEFNKSRITGIEIKLSKNANENDIIAKLNRIFSNRVIIKTRAQLNESLYKMLNTENTIIYLIFTLVIILTLFTLAGAIIMMILDKKDNLKTLLNLGTPIRDLQKIFLFQGTLLSLIGGHIGIALGTIIILVQQHYKLIMITKTLPYPIIFNFENVTAVLVTITLLGFFASLIASSKVNSKLLSK